MDLNAVLTAQNPWWRPNFNLQSQPELALTPRFALNSLTQAFKGTGLMLFLKGMRRLGKSTILKQLIFSLLKEGMPADKILFAEFSQSWPDLEAVLAVAKSTDKSVIFLDEIQYCQNWRDSLKKFYDLTPNIRVIFTGSAGLNVTKEKESLLGRFLPIEVLPLSFHEYLHLKYGPKYSNVHKNQAEWEEYLQFGEFPETLKISSSDLQYLYLRSSLLEPLLTTDASLYNIESTAEFAAFLKALAANIAQVINKQNIAAEIGVSRPQINKYLAILEDIGLVKVVPNYYQSIRQQIHSDKKIFFTSSNLVLALLGLREVSSWESLGFKGHLLENAIFNQLLCRFDKIFYWRRKDKELDFIGEKGNDKAAYEVKSKDTIHDFELRQYQNYAEDVGAATFQLIYSGKSDEKRCLINALEI